MGCCGGHDHGHGHHGHHGHEEYEEEESCCCGGGHGHSHDEEEEDDLYQERRFLTREEKIAKLEEYQDMLEKELTGVKEAIEELKQL